MDVSALQKARYEYKPKLPGNISGDIGDMAVELGSPTGSVSDEEALRGIFKNSFGKPLAVIGKGKIPNIRKEFKAGVIHGEIFRTYPDRLWGPPSLLYNDMI